MLLLTLFALLAHPAATQELVAAPAGPGSLEGTVVAVSPTELVIDLGYSRGLPVGALVDVLRRIEIRHPQTGEVLVDRFPIGRVRLEVGAVLSISRDLGGLSQPAAVGDSVVFEGPTSEPVAPSPASGPTAVAADPEPAQAAAAPLPAQPTVARATASSRLSPAEQAEAAAVVAFERTLGRPLDQRLAIWRSYLRSYPDSPLLNDVANEILWLTDQAAPRRAAEAANRSAGFPAWVSTPHLVPTGSPLEVWAGIVDGDRVEAVRLLLRRSGDATFTTVPMTADGDFNWRGEVPPSLVEEPGRIEYAVEAVLHEGVVESIAGSASAPQAIVVEAVETDAPELEGRSLVHTSFDFVDFSLGPSVEDQFLRFESSYRYTVDFGAFETFTVGVGIIEGAGGDLDALDAGEPATKRTVNYGFAELGFAFAPTVGGRLRLLAGNTAQSPDESLSGVFGGGFGLRFGRTDSTHLLLDAALTEEIGNQFSAEFVIAAVDRVPMIGSAVVTNLPVGADYGVSLGYSIGYELTDWLSLSARTGINARTTEHLGVTGGVGATLDW